MGKKYLNTKSGTLEDSILSVWQNAAEELDPVNKKAVKKKFKNRKDKDLDNDINFYNVKTKQFHLNKYKGTAMDKHGKKVYRIPQYIADMITKEYNDDSKYLIGKTKTETYPQGSLVKFIFQASKKYYGTRFGINDMRQSIISFYHENKDIKKRKQLAEIMLNSYQEQLKSYKREELGK